jgi:hypothetical protein
MGCSCGDDGGRQSRRSCGGTCRCAKTSEPRERNVLDSLDIYYHWHSSLLGHRVTLYEQQATNSSQPICLPLTTTAGSHDSTPRPASHVQGTDVAEKLLSLQTRTDPGHYQVGGARWTRQHTNSACALEDALLYTSVSLSCTYRGDTLTPIVALSAPESHLAARTQPGNGSPKRLKSKFKQRKLNGKPNDRPSA